MKIFSPHRRRMEAKKRFGGKEFRNKIKKAQNYKRVFDPRTRTAVSSFFKMVGLGSVYAKLAAAILILIPAYFLFVSDYFVVSSVAAYGGTQVRASHIQSIFDSRSTANNFFIPKNHLIFLNRSKVESLLMQEFPLIKEIAEFKIIWPNKIELEIIERQPGFAFQSSNQIYLVDDHGLVVKPIEDTQGLTVVVNQVEEHLQPGEQLNNGKLVGFVLSVIRQWPSKVSSQIKEARVPGKAAGQIQLVSTEGWSVFFDINLPVESQLSSLALILSKQIPAKDRLNLAYIDLRFDKWAYYCYKDQPCQSEPRTQEELAPPVVVTPTPTE